MSQISVISVPVKDQDRALAFYKDVLGFTLVMDNPMGNMRWVMMQPPGGGANVTLVTWFPSMAPGSLRGTVLSVPNIEAMVEHLQTCGVQPAEESIQEAPWGRWVTINDVDGNGWVIQQNR